MPAARAKSLLTRVSWMCETAQRSGIPLPDYVSRKESGECIMPKDTARDSSSRDPASISNPPNLPMRGVPQPARNSVLSLPEVYISQHPVVAHKISLLRDRNTDPADFYLLVRELGTLLAYEATSDLHTVPIPVETPLEPMMGSK